MWVGGDGAGKGVDLERRWSQTGGGPKDREGRGKGNRDWVVSGGRSGGKGGGGGGGWYARVWERGLPKVGGCTVAGRRGAGGK